MISQSNDLHLEQLHAICHCTMFQWSHSAYRCAGLHAIP